MAFATTAFARSAAVGPVCVGVVEQPTARQSMATRISERAKRSRTCGAVIGSPSGPETENETSEMLISTPVLRDGDTCQTKRQAAFSHTHSPRTDDTKHAAGASAWFPRDCRGSIGWRHSCASGHPFSSQGTVMVDLVTRNIPKTIDAISNRSVLFVLLLLTAARALAGSATLAWDPVSSPVLAGY